MTDYHTDAGAAGRHSDIAPELRQLAESILDRLGPVAKLLVSRVQTGGPGKCEQVWCPVCAVVALISGEQHPLLSVVAEHSVGLLTLAKTMLDNLDGAGATTPQVPDQTADAATGQGETGPSEPGRYEPITVVLDEQAGSVVDE